MAWLELSVIGSATAKNGKDYKATALERDVEESDDDIEAQKEKNREIATATTDDEERVPLMSSNWINKSQQDLVDNYLRVAIDLFLTFKLKIVEIVENSCDLNLSL